MVCYYRYKYLNYDILIEKATHTKFLGFMLSEDLTWNEHLKVLLSKVNKNFDVLANSAICYPVLLLSSIIPYIPYTDYCNIVWATQSRIWKRRVALWVQGRIWSHLCEFLPRTSNRHPKIRHCSLPSATKIWQSKVCPTADPIYQ